MENITIAKALKTIVLPDGKTVHEGDEFVYNHDFENCGEFEIVGEQNGDKAPAPQQPEKDPEVVASEMENTTAAPAPEQPVADNLTPTYGASANA